MSEQHQVSIGSSHVDKPHPSDGHTPETSKEQITEIAATIAAHLGETDAAPCTQIRRAVKVLGAEANLAILRKTMEIEEGGGMMLPDQSRRRTAGGIFFLLIRTTMPRQVRGRIFLTSPKPGTASPSLTPEVSSTQASALPSAPAHPVFTDRK